MRFFRFIRITRKCRVVAPGVGDWRDRRVRCSAACVPVARALAERADDQLALIGIDGLRRPAGGLANGFASTSAGAACVTVPPVSPDPVAAGRPRSSGRTTTRAGSRCAAQATRSRCSSSRTLPGQLVGSQCGEGLWVQVDAFDAELVPGHVEKIAGQHGEILAMPAQRRHGDRIDVQTVKEIAAEAPGVDLVAQGRDWWRQ